MSEIITGSRVPDVQFARLEAGKIVSISATELFAYGRALILGVPGAFTPVCSKEHVPDFVQNADG